MLVVALAIEFAVSTVIYERASEFSVRADEARRLAEHLAIARRLVAEQPRADRHAMADELTTDRYYIRWSAARPVLPAQGDNHDRMRGQIIAWEPALAGAELEAHTLPRNGSTIAVGSLRLREGDWLLFRTIEPLQTSGATYERILSSSVIVLVLTLFGGLFIRRTLQPIRSLTEVVDRFGPALDHDPAPSSPSGDGDVQRLVHAFTAMQSRIRRLIDERTRALAAVSHDLRTPLARLRLRAEAIEDLALRRDVEGDVAGMDAMVTSLLAFLGGDGEAEAPQLVDLAVLCASSIDDASDHGQKAVYGGPEHLEMWLRPIAIRRAVVNLIDNAVRYGSEVSVTLGVTGETATVTVADDGPGIPEESFMLVREPFVRLDQARSHDTDGFGLGLSIVERAVEDEGGSLTLANRPSGGLAATIRLPYRRTVQQHFIT